jgi:Mg2+/Co2+ transporter CorC
LIFARIGSVPHEGDTLEEDGVILTVEALHERRVHQVHAVLPASTQNNPQMKETSPDDNS